MRRNRELYHLERKYIGKHVKYYMSDLPKRGSRKLPKYGPYYGVVLMLTNDKAYAELRGEKSYGFTGSMLIYPDDGAEEVFISIEDVYITIQRREDETN